MSAGVRPGRARLWSDLVFLLIVTVCVVEGASVRDEVLTCTLGELVGSIPRKVALDPTTNEVRSFGRGARLELQFFAEPTPVSYLGVFISEPRRLRQRKVELEFVPFDASGTEVVEWLPATRRSFASDTKKLEWFFAEPAARMRLKLPDGASFVVERFWVESPANAAPWGGVAALVLLGYGCWRLAPSARRCMSSAQLVWAGALVLSAAKLWLVQGQGRRILGFAAHDDYYFIRQASFLLRGEWLGPYDHMTLVKGPVYSLWIALSFLTGIPLWLSEHLLYVSACVLVVVALRPLIASPAARFLVYCVLLFNPSTWEHNVLRVAREGIYPALTLWTMACAFGLFLRRRDSVWSMSAWSIGLGTSMAALWLTREEGVWLLPSLALVLGVAVFSVLRGPTSDKLARILVCAVPLAVWGGAVLLVSAINYHHYGIFNPVELKTREWKSAYGALLRVEHAEWQRYVPLPKETRQRIYAVSPAFAELEPFLEGTLGMTWASEDGEIKSGFFGWAFRDAVALAGYQSRGRQGLEYYERLGREVNAACESGALDCRTSPSVGMTQWRSEYLALMAGILPDAAFRMLALSQIATGISEQSGGAKRISEFRDLMREPARRDTGPARLTHQVRWNDRKVDALRWVETAYRWIAPGWAALSLTGLGAAIAIRFARRKQDPLLLLSVALVTAILVRLLLLSLLEVSAFKALNALYLAPSYALLLLLYPIGTIHLFAALRVWFRPGASPDNS